MSRFNRARCAAGLVIGLPGPSLHAQTLSVAPGGTIAPGQFTAPLAVQFTAGTPVSRVYDDLRYDKSRFFDYASAPSLNRCYLDDAYVRGSMGSGSPFVAFPDTTMCSVRLEARWNAPAGPSWLRITTLIMSGVYPNDLDSVAGARIDGWVTVGAAPTTEPTYSRPPNTTITLDATPSTPSTVDIAVTAGNTRRRLDCSVSGGGMSLSRGSRFAVSPADPPATIGLRCTQPIVPTQGFLSCTERQAWPTLDTRLLVWAVQCR